MSVSTILVSLRPSRDSRRRPESNRSMREMLPRMNFRDSPISSPMIVFARPRRSSGMRVSDRMVSISLIAYSSSRLNPWTFTRGLRRSCDVAYRTCSNSLFLVFSSDVSAARACSASLRGVMSMNEAIRPIDIPLPSFMVDADSSAEKVLPSFRCAITSTATVLRSVSKYFSATASELLPVPNNRPK